MEIKNVTSLVPSLVEFDKSSVIVLIDIVNRKVYGLDSSNDSNDLVGDWSTFESKVLHFVDEANRVDYSPPLPPRHILDSISSSISESKLKLSEFLRVEAAENGKEQQPEEDQPEVEGN